LVAGKLNNIGSYGSDEPGISLVAQPSKVSAGKEGKIPGELTAKPAFVVGFYFS
jgi:hypothetical protein